MATRPSPEVLILVTCCRDRLGHYVLSTRLNALDHTSALAYSKRSMPKKLPTTPVGV